ncbi:hypothetical protein LPJ64_006256 [Coemansia asiatica]|uniref:DEK-C domain-containing protein n=1 Tax=Coemansia asiatica TaxID=1052880 RepID=A0A9W8CGV4_9FUNG|nr:hypothetical protein LPJ64_006256 [Coemansia asiatica]
MELATAGVLNAPPPNMNPNAGSSKEDDRGTMFSCQSAAMGAGGRYGAHTPVAPVPRASTPNTMISGSGSIDPRLQLSTPVAQAQQIQHYSHQSQGMTAPRAMSAASGVMPSQTVDGTMASRVASYYQQSPGGGYQDTISPTHSASALLAAGAPMGMHAGMSPGSADYFQSPAQGTSSNTMSRSGPGTPSAGGLFGQVSQFNTISGSASQQQQQQLQQRESMFSSSSYGVPSMYVPPSAPNPALQGGGAPGMMMTGAMPTDDQLVNSIKRILGSQDLNTVTKKSVRAQLTKEYGVDLIARKEFIGDAIELILAGQL